MTSLQHHQPCSCLQDTKACIGALSSLFFFHPLLGMSPILFLGAICGFHVFFVYFSHCKLQLTLSTSFWLLFEAFLRVYHELCLVHACMHIYMFCYDLACLDMLHRTHLMYIKCDFRCKLLLTSVALHAYILCLCSILFPCCKCQ